MRAAARAAAALADPRPGPARDRPRRRAGRRARPALGPHAARRARRGGARARRRPRVRGRGRPRRPRPLRAPAAAVGGQSRAARLRAVQGRLGRRARQACARACARPRPRACAVEPSRPPARASWTSRRRTASRPPRCSGRRDAALAAVEAIAERLPHAEPRIGGLLRRRLESLAWHPDLAVRCLAYRTLLLDDPLPGYEELLASFVESGQPFLTAESIDAIARARPEPHRLESLRLRLRGYRRDLAWPASAAVRAVFENVFELLARTARERPEHLVPVRAELASWALFHADPALAACARELLGELAQWCCAHSASRVGAGAPARPAGRRRGGPPRARARRRGLPAAVGRAGLRRARRARRVRRRGRRLGDAARLDPRPRPLPRQLPGPATASTATCCSPCAATSAPPPSRRRCCG